MGFLDLLKRGDSTESGQQLLGERKLIKGEDLEAGEGVRSDLELVEERAFRKGVVVLRYAVRG